MSLHWPSNGEYSAPAYQLSALPYVSSSIISAGQVHTYNFAFVTKFISIVNRGANTTDKLAIGFTENGLKPTVGNYFTLGKGETVREEIRTTTLFISCSAGSNIDYQIFCGLTTIPADSFLPITGSNGHTGVG